MRWLKRQFNKIKRWLTKDRRQTELPLPKPLPTKPKPIEKIPVETVGMEGSPTKISMAGVALIISFEGFSSSPYLDVAGVPTIGYGTIRYKNGRLVRLSDAPISEEDARAELAYEVDKKCALLVKFIKKYKFKVVQHELDALCSFVYNLGIGAVINRGSTVGAGIMSSDRKLVTKGIMLYNKAWTRNRFGIKVFKAVKGLTRRRKAEVDMFKVGSYE